MPIPGLGPLLTGPRGGSAPFSPLDLPGLTSWFHAGAGVTLSGSEVTDIADQSGAGIVPVLSRLIAGPTFLASGINGLPDLDWSAGSQTALVDPAANALLGTTAITLFAIMQSTNTATGRLWGMQYNGFQYLLAVNFSGGFGDGIASYLTWDVTEARSDNPVTDGTPHVLIATWSQADDTARIFVDGTTAAVITAASTGPITGAASDHNTAGSSSDGSALFQTYTGRMPEWGSYNVALAGSDLAALHTYLANKAGI